MIDIKELREAIQTFGSQAINEGDLNELLDRLEAAESVLEGFGTTAQEVECWLERYRRLEREAEEMRTKITEMEGQEPVAIAKRSSGGVSMYLVGDVSPGDVLYLAAGAKGE